MIIHIENETLESIKSLRAPQIAYEDAGDFKKARTAHNLITFQCREAVLSEIARIDKANKREHGQ